MEDLPKLPGNAFPDLTRLDFNVPHHFDWCNGYRVIKTPNVGIGKQPLDTESIAYAFDKESVRYDPTLVYGRIKDYIPPECRPHFVLYDKKCLSFDAYMSQVVTGELRIRFVKVTYFLEDDTITVLEPKTINPGFVQGKLVKRGRFPRDESGQLFHWKDLNVGMDLHLNGMIFHLYKCDKFTREFLKSQGIIVNPEEECPTDPYTEKRLALANRKLRVTSDVDNMKKLILFEGKVLRFQALWDDDGPEFAAKTKFAIYYHLQDDTVEVFELRTPNSGKFGSNKILKRRKVPKYLREIDDKMPTYLELTEVDVDTFLGPVDFIVGKTVTIFYRKYLLLDCDDFTRNYYATLLHIQQPDPIKIVKTEQPKPAMSFPPYFGFGTPEDSLQSFFKISPNKPKKDEMRMLINMNKSLRYSAELDWIHPEDQVRKFIIEYRLTDGAIKISELKVPNSGFGGGKFLKPTLVPRPDSDPNNPSYIKPTDFVLGEPIIIFNHRFIITGMDVGVFRYMEANPEKFSEEALNEARRYLVREGTLAEEVTDVAEFRKREEIAEPKIVEDGTNIEGYSALNIQNQPNPLTRQVCKILKKEEEVVPLT